MSSLRGFVLILAIYFHVHMQGSAVGGGGGSGGGVWSFDLRKNRPSFVHDNLANSIK